MRLRVLTVPVYALLLAGPSLAAEGSCADIAAETLTGGWSGLQAGLCERGISAGLTHKSDLFRNASGGVERGSVWLMNTEATFDIDLQQLAGWEGATALVHYHIQHGADSINRYTGSISGVSNIETDTHAGQFFQMWVQQEMAERWSLLGGLYAVDSEFYVTDTSGLFIQPPYGMSVEMAQTGRNGPPIFPVGALGMRLRYATTDHYLQAALTDGVPGDPGNPGGTHVRFDQGDGTLLVVEAGLTEDEGGTGVTGKTAIGLWRYSSSVDDLSDTDAQGQPVQRRDMGAYFISERSLFSEPGDPGQGLAGFLRFGMVNRDAYQADWSGSMGLSYRGLLDGRDGDEAGLAVTVVHAGSKFRRLNAAEPYELAVELTYRASITPWLALQPDVQYFHHPNMDPSLRDAWVAGVRLEAAL